VNNQLYGKVWQFPQHMQQHMKVCFAKIKNADANVEGYNRNRRLQTASQVGYPELKRIKNYVAINLYYNNTIIYNINIISK
jgi:hypothetical protein